MPIFRLSEDVLLNIFLMCSDVDLKLGHYVAELDWDWIAVSHVCGYWRTLAISSPILWRRPTLARHSRDRLETFFERSQNAPLDISTFYRCKIRGVGSGECTTCQDNAILALHHLPRIRHLSIFSTSFEMLNGMIENSAPLLQDLTLTCDSRTSGDIPICLPSDFSARAQSMKRLILRGFYMPYDSQMLRGLECLRISHLTFHPYPAIVAQYYPTLNELLDILSTSRTLQELELLTIRGSTGNEGLRAKYRLNRIFLPSLYSLKIEEIEIGVFEELLKCIKTPIGIDIAVGLRFTGVNEFDQILDILTYIGEHNYGTSLDVRQLNGLIDLSLDVNLETAPITQQGSMHTYLTLIQVDEDGSRLSDNDIDYEGVSEMTMNLIRCSHWNHVTSLRFTVSSHYSVITDQEWRTFLDAFKSVNYLNIRVHDVTMLDNADVDEAVLENVLLLEKNLLSSLTLPPIHDDFLQEPQSTYILPCLEKISLDISSVSHFPVELLLCVKLRSECGQPVRDLCFFSLKIFPNADDHDNWLSEIEKYVGRVKIYSW